MRNNQLPTTAEILEFLPRPFLSEKERVTREILIATIGAELALGEDLRPRKIAVTLTMGSNMVVALEHFPVRDFRIVGPNIEYYLEEDHGLIWPEAGTANYDVTYETGYRKGELPAAYKELVASLVRRVLTCSDEDNQQAIQMLEVCRRMRKSKEEERNARKIGRESTGQANAWYSAGRSP